MAQQLPPYQLSYWERKAFFQTVDFLVVGSGIVGLSAALYLKEKHPDSRVAVVERGPLPIGASTRNAGFACFGSMTELLEDLPRMGSDAVWSLVEKRWKGLQKLRKRVGDGKLSFEAHGGYELFRPGEESRFEACMAKKQEFNRILREITGNEEVFSLADDKIASFGFQGVAHLVFSSAEGQLHPGFMVAALWEQALDAGVKLLTGLSVSGLQESDKGVEVELSSPGWTLAAKKVLVATNGFARRLLPDLPVKPARNQVLVTAPLSRIPFKGVFHYDSGYYYFRNIDDRVLLGGGRNLAMQEEFTDEFGTTPRIREALLQMLREVILPGEEVAVSYWWSGILGVGDVKAPIIRKISPRIAVAVRLGGMGVAIGSLVGEEGAQLLEEELIAG